MPDKIRKDLENAGFVEVWADVDLAYGGIFIRDERYFDVIRITDLASACGADGQVLVEALTTAFPIDKHQLASVLSSQGYDSLTHIDKEYRRVVLASAMVEYGLYDPQGYGQSYFVAILDRSDYNDAREKWEVNVKGWGMAAFRRAVGAAIDLCDGYQIPSMIE
jgi:hypothetical protein